MKDELNEKEMKDKIFVSIIIVNYNGENNLI